MSTCWNILSAKVLFSPHRSNLSRLHIYRFMTPICHRLIPTGPTTVTRRLMAVSLYGHLQMGPFCSAKLPPFPPTHILAHILGLNGRDKSSPLRLRRLPLLRSHWHLLCTLSSSSRLFTELAARVYRSSSARAWCVVRERLPEAEASQASQPQSRLWQAVEQQFWLLSVAS